MIVTMVALVRTIPERPVSPNRPKVPPIVPSMRSAMSNRPFRILLPAWACDAFVNGIIQCIVPYYVEAVVAPAYQTMEEHGRDCYPSSPDFEGGKWDGKDGREGNDIFCDTNSVIAMCGILVL